MISQLQGLCTTDENPDAWFPTIDNGKIDTMNRRALPMVQYAIGVCSRCPIREKCLEEGIKPENLAHGIWGGLFPAQRIAIAKERGVDYRVDRYNTGRQTSQRYTNTIGPSGKVTADEENAAVIMYNRLRPYLEGAI